MGSQGATIETTALGVEFEAAWSSIGPFDHPLEALYRAAARRILDQASGRSRIGITFGDVLQVKIDGHTIAVPIDELERVGSGFTVRRLRTGRPPKKSDQRVLHALMAEAGRQAHGGGGRFELQYLTTSEAVGVSLGGVMADRLDKTRGALADLAAGQFPAAPENREDCPRCPHYFICPSVPA
jgi:DNA helicase-2/ATP-dependent DNA helicase PcrA